MVLKSKIFTFARKKYVEGNQRQVSAPKPMGDVRKELVGHGGTIAGSPFAHGHEFGARIGRGSVLLVLSAPGVPGLHQPGGAVVAFAVL